VSGVLRPSSRQTDSMSVAGSGDLSSFGLANFDLAVGWSAGIMSLD
jgi:hypothetical protein